MGGGREERCGGCGRVRGNSGNRGNGGMGGRFRGGRLENGPGVGGGEFSRHNEDVFGERRLEGIIDRLQRGNVETWKPRRREGSGEEGGRARQWREAPRNRCLGRRDGSAFDRIRSSYQQLRGVGGAQPLLRRLGEEPSNEVLRSKVFSGSTRADSSTNAGNSMDSGANAAIFSKIR